MRFCVDIDGTICSPTKGRDYENAEPWKERIDEINKLYDEGHYIIYFTARAMGRFSNEEYLVAGAKATAVLFELTQKQLKEWGAKYHELIMGKPHADYFIDDKGMSAHEFFIDAN